MLMYITRGVKSVSVYIIKFGTVPIPLLRARSVRRDRTVRHDTGFASYTPFAMRPRMALDFESRLSSIN